MPDIKTIGVCGAGVMGAQLAALFAGAGYKVLLYDLKQEFAEKGLQGALKARPLVAGASRKKRRVQVKQKARTRMSGSVVQGLSANTNCGLPPRRLHSPEKLGEAWGIVNRLQTGALPLHEAPDQLHHRVHLGIEIQAGGVDGLRVRRPPQR